MKDIEIELCGEYVCPSVKMIRWAIAVYRWNPKALSRFNQTVIDLMLAGF